MVNVCHTRQDTIEIEKGTRSAALESLTPQLQCSIPLYNIVGRQCSLAFSVHNSV